MEAQQSPLSIAPVLLDRPESPIRSLKVLDREVVVPEASTLSINQSIERWFKASRSFPVDRESQEWQQFLKASGRNWSSEEEQDHQELVSVPLMIKNSVIGVFNLYTSQERQFSNEEIQLISTVANQAAVAIENTKLMADTLSMRVALQTRKLVERAKGLLIKEEKITEDEAYRRIQQKSMKLRKSMREIAEAIVLAAEIKM
jgi:transcriptional regulator with GAF, ATPase, and Fis domain